MAAVTVASVAEPDFPDACLMLLSDLTGNLPADSVFDFQVDFFQDLGPGKGAIGLLIDNSQWSTHYDFHCELTDQLDPGYHLVRAFLMDESAGGMTQCVKQPSAYIEAEFFVDTPSMPTARGFMFGQPSLCLLSPRTTLSRKKEELVSTRPPSHATLASPDLPDPLPGLPPPLSPRPPRARR